ncbi:MAG: TPM domain-containing protein [Bryobacteraceae bacterium]
MALPLFGEDVNSLQPQGYVSDFAHVLDDASKARIEQYGAEVEHATGAQIALVTVNSTDGNPIEDYANTLFRKWGVGKKGQDTGLLMLFAIKDHKDRIEVGYGLEPILPDGFVGDALRQVRPSLRQGDYGTAMLTAAEIAGATIAKSKGVTLQTHLVSPEYEHRTSHGGEGLPWPLIVIGAFILFSLIGRLFHGGGGGYGGGSGGSGIGGFLTGMLLGNLLGGGRGGGGGWGGGGFGGGGFGGSDSGSGGGFGGFGGGDSGGGGASSDW